MSSDLISLLILIVVALPTSFAIIIVLPVVLLFIHLVLLFIAELLVGRMLLSLWNWLILLWRLNLIDVLVIVVHYFDNHSGKLINYKKGKVS